MRNKNNEAIMHAVRNNKSKPYVSDHRYMAGYIRNAINDKMIKKRQRMSFMC
jgi:hypothetical protein